MDNNKALVVYKKKGIIFKDRINDLYQRFCCRAAMVFRSNFKVLAIYFCLFSLFCFIGACFAVRFADEIRVVRINND